MKLVQLANVYNVSVLFGIYTVYNMAEKNIGLGKVLKGPLQCNQNLRRHKLIITVEQLSKTL